MISLTVWLDEVRAGRLWERVGEKADGRLCFQYDPDWVSNPDRYPLSRSLPVVEEVQDGASVRSFFSGLLPEGGVRQQVAANLGLSEANDFALLAALGGDCAGALRLTGEEGEAAEKREEPQELDEAALGLCLHELPRRPLLAGEGGVRLSLAGAQSKLPVRFVGGRWSLSSFYAPSTHILKPENRNFPGLAAVEGFCLDLAGRVGIPTVEGRVVEFGDLPCLVVTRYDREVHPETGVVRRRHQEDLCQAMGLPPHRKYQQEGGPSAADTLMCIRAWSSVPVLDMGFFLDLWIFNVLIGNADAHGKNLSWLYTQGQRRLAPAYDLVSTVLWPELSPRMAMRVGQAKYLEEVTLDHFMKFARANRIGVAGFRKRMQEFCATVCGQVAPALDAATSLSSAFRGQLEHGIQSRAAKLAGR